MDEVPDLPLDIVELGSAKEVTQGSSQGVAAELNEAATYKP